jgi:hypothetical protein
MNEQGVCHTSVALPFTWKKSKYLKPKEEEFMETQIFSPSMQKIY